MAPLEALIVPWMQALQAEAPASEN